MIWKFPLSDGKTYSIKPMGYKLRWIDTKIQSNLFMTISFTLNVRNNIGQWRNIFLLTNKDDSVRMPAIYLYPYESKNTKTSRLHIRWKTRNNWNNGYDPTEFNLNSNQNIEMSWIDDIFIFKLNGKEVYNQKYESPTEQTNANAMINIGAYNNDSNGINITNFQISDYLPPVINKVGLWNFPFSVNNWYRVRPNGFSTKWNDINIRSTQNMVISFSLIIENKNGSWRNIFRVTNTNNNCCNNGDRIPALWIFPNQTRFHLRFSSSAGGNDGIDSNIQLPLNKEVQVKLIWKENYCTIMIDGKIDVQRFFNSSVPAFIPTPNTYLFIADKFHDASGIQIKNFKITDDILESDKYTLLKSGSNDNTFCAGSKINAGRLSLNDCSKRCDQDINCTGFDISNISIENSASDIMTFNCNLNNSNNVAIAGITNNAFGCYKKNNVSSQSCSYRLGEAEKKCYMDRYPDLVSAKVNPQDHWSQYGCNEKRDNQCPVIKLQSGNYKYQGCFKDSSIRDQRNVKTFRGLVNSIDDCANLAEQNKDDVFAIYNNLNCYTDKNVAKATDSKNRNVNKTECSDKGGTNTNQVYVRNPLFPVDNNPAKLHPTNFNYTPENYINSESLENMKDINTIEFIKYIIVLFIIIILIFLICLSIKNKK